VAAITNEAQERLINDPMAPDEGWWGGWARMNFNVQATNRYAYITTPREVARLIGMTVCEAPIRLRNGFYEFLEFGTGLQPKTQPWCNGTISAGCVCGTVTEAYDRENVVTLASQIVIPATIRFYPSDASDLGKRILLQGLDQNGKNVLSIDPATKQAISGEYITLAMPFVDSAYQYNSVSGFIKDMTAGPLTIMQVNPTTGDETALSSMEPGEVTASYRRYLINGLPNRCCNAAGGTVQVTTMAKLDYIPAQSPADYLMIQSIPALIEEVQSIRYSRMDAAEAPKLEEKHHAKALQLLFGQLDHYLGKTQTAIHVPIFGSDRPRLQPR